MKILLAIIITATLSFGCAMLEGEQKTTDSGGGGATPEPSAPTPAVANWSGTKQLGTSSDDYANCIATDASGNVYVNGDTWGGLDGNTNAGGDDIFVVKYNSTGVKQWTQQLGSSNSDYAQGTSTDSSCNVYVNGDTPSGLDGNTNAESYDLFVVKYDTDGNKQ